MVTCIGIAWGYNTAFTNYIRPITLTIGTNGIVTTNELQYWNDWTYQVIEIMPITFSL